nr:MAG: major capsid protein [Microviridae sp.]
MKKRNKFSLSHYRLLTGKMGYIIPIGLVEVLPGDSIRHATSMFLRLAPMLAPVMHPCHVKIHTWYVPHRLVWDEFEDFITGGPDGLNASVFPTITAPSGGFPVGSLADYLGVPTGVPGLVVSALPFRCYNMIYNMWYRDQDLESELVISTDSGADTTTVTNLMRGDWARDIFTTARPWPQKGMTVTVPVTGAASGLEVVGNGTPSLKWNTTQLKPDVQHSDPSVTLNGGRVSFGSSFKTGGIAWETSGHATAGTGILNFNAPASFTKGNANIPSAVSARVPLYWDNPALSVRGSVGDLGQVDINLLREAFALQRFEEHRAMYGSRYVEYLRYLGIKASDARLQRPEYLGGGQQTIQFSEVLQTAEGTDPVGTLRGHGIAAMRSNRYRRFIEEHGYIMSFVMIRPKSIYMQGIDRTWLRRVKEDFWQKELEHIGQQEVYTQELYAGDSTGPTSADEIFGYQNRYDDYRQHWSSVSGEFRNILKYWHMAREFGNKPVLNADFISSVPTERIFAAQQNDQLYMMVNHSIQARRLMSKFGNPI